MADPNVFNYNQYSSIIDLHNEYLITASGIWRSLVDVGATSGKTEVQIQTPLVTPTGNVSWLGAHDSDFPDDAYVMSWYGMPEVYRGYWDQIADLIAGSPRGSGYTCHETFCDVYGDPFDSEVIIGPGWTGNQYAHYYVRSGQGQPPSEALPDYYVFLPTEGVNPRPVTPTWHGSQNDGYYNWESYSELFDNLTPLTLGPSGEKELWLEYCKFYNSIGFESDSDAHTAEAGFDVRFFYSARSTGGVQYIHITVSGSFIGGSSPIASNVLVRWTPDIAVSGKGYNSIADYTFEKVFTGDPAIWTSPAIEVNPGHITYGCVHFVGAQFFAGDGTFPDIDVYVGASGTVLEKQEISKFFPGYAIPYI